jgi:hypothetical protein
MPKKVTQKLSAELNISDGDAAKIVKSVFGQITDALASGQSVEIDGFGKFYVVNGDAFGPISLGAKLDPAKIAERGFPKRVRMVKAKLTIEL